jgi:hypothetical protein
VLQFFCFLLFIVVAEIAAVVWAYSNSDKVESYVESSVRSTVQEEYGVVDTRTATFDAIQKGVLQSFCLIYYHNNNSTNNNLRSFWMKFA